MSSQRPSRPRLDWSGADGHRTPLPRHQHGLTDAMFLGEFDVGRPELAGVAEAMEVGDLGAAKAALVEHMRTRREPRWLFDLRGVEASAGAPLFHLWPPKVVDDPQAVVARADLVCDNRFTITDGYVLDFGPHWDWVTPETRALIVPGNAFKCCHWLGDLAFAWALTGDARYARKWVELVDRWADDFALFLDDDFTGEEMIFNRGFGEKSMPTGQRLFNWLSCLYTGIPFAPEASVETAFRFIKMLWYNGAVYQHFEASPFQRHNHHIMRTVNVPACMALAFPETPRFGGLLAMARDRMARHVEESFLSDHGYVERSSSYAQVTVGMLTAPLALAQLNGVDLADEETTERLRLAGRFIAATVMPNGSLPPSGDGCTDNLGANAASLVLTGLALGSDLTASVLQRTGLDQYLPMALRPEPAEVHLPRHCHCPGWGIAVLRTGWADDASALSMNIPDGVNPNHSHAHDDALSCNLVMGGRSIITVPATELYLYVNAAEWVKTPHYSYLRSSQARNVVLPAGAVRPTKEAWQTDTPDVVSSLLETATGVELTAQATVSGAHWERCVCLDGDVWAIHDRLARGPDCAADAPHLLQWHFQYGVEVTQTADGVLADDGHVRVRLTLGGDTPWSTDLSRNTEWLKPNKGRQHEPAPWVLVVSFGADSRVACMTTRFELDQSPG